MTLQIIPRIRLDGLTCKGLFYFQVIRWDSWQKEKHVLWAEHLAKKEWGQAVWVPVPAYPLVTGVLGDFETRLKFSASSCAVWWVVSRGGSARGPPRCFSYLLLTAKIQRCFPLSQGWLHNLPGPLIKMQEVLWKILKYKRFPFFHRLSLNLLQCILICHVMFWVQTVKRILIIRMNFAIYFCIVNANFKCKYKNI